MLRDLHHIARTYNVGFPRGLRWVYTVFSVYVPTWWHRKSPWSSISPLCRWLPAISALTQRCDALEKSQILSRRNIIQFLKPHNNPMIKQLSLIRKTRRLQIWSRRSILSWWQHQMSVRELRHDRPSGRFSKSRHLSASISFLSSPPPPRSFTCAIFRAVFHSCSSFFAPKPHRNACYASYLIAGYLVAGVWEGVFVLILRSWDTCSCFYFF